MIYTLNNYLNRKPMPIADFEEHIGLAEQQRRLNEKADVNSRERKACPAAVNQVYICSMVRYNGRLKKETPHLCIDCKVRDHLGWNKKVDAHTIETICTEPVYTKCPAYSRFMQITRNIALRTVEGATKSPTYSR